MYQDCNCNGLGFIDTLASAAASLIGGGSDTGGATMPNVTVSPNISTQISPQISPVFQQQFQPQNSAATAGTAQSVPSMPAQIDSGYNPMSVPGQLTLPTPVSAAPQQPDYVKYMPYAIAALGILAFVTIKKRPQK